jgi:hypothetical protein
MAGIMAAAVISTFLIALIGRSSHESKHLILQHTDQRCSYDFFQPFPHHMLKRVLMSYEAFAIVGCVGHWYLPVLSWVSLPARNTGPHQFTQYSVYSPISSFTQSGKRCFGLFEVLRIGIPPSIARMLLFILIL